MGQMDLPTILTKQRGMLQLCHKKGLIIPQAFFNIWIQAAEVRQRTGAARRGGQRTDLQSPRVCLRLSRELTDLSCPSICCLLVLFRSYQEFASGVESAASLTSTLSQSNGFVPPLLQFSGLLLDGMRHYFARRFAEANHTFDLIGPVKHASTSIPTLVTCAFFECLALLADCPRFSLRDYPDAVAATVAPDAGLPVLMPDDYDANDVMRRLARVDALIASMVGQALSAGDVARAGSAAVVRQCGGHSRL